MILKFTNIFFTCILLFVHISTKANFLFQQDTLKKSLLVDTIPISKTDSLVSKTDTLKKNSKKGQITDVIKAVASDSSYYDVKNNVMYLYGNGRITYGEKQVDAGYIKVDYKKNTIIAKSKVDSLGRKSGLPIFKDPSQGTITADSIYYNFKTSKGNVFQVYSEQDGGYITGGKLKKQPNDEVHLKNVTYSTCNLPSPHQHFGIIITKGIATEKQIVTGPAYMLIEDVPLPFIIPFGFFPKPNKRASGIILPQVGEDATLGFFLRDFGYYLGLNDYWDLTLKGGIYSKGSYEGNIASRYTKRYKYNGNFFCNFSFLNTLVIEFEN